jgi:arsenite methyltransferase
MTITTVDQKYSVMNQQVSEYYGKTLKTTDDLKTNACCTAGAPPRYIRDAIANIDPLVLSKYYGCGLCLPQYDMTGLRVLDLGCGAGRDVYIAAQLVGPTGSVVGVDMTPEQLDVALEKKAYHAEKFGFDNVEFYQGYLERLDEMKELEKGSFDLIISNCVINLCEDKEAVLRHCHELLKPGGELYFSDVYSSRRVPQALREDPVLWGECLSGALYWNDFQNLARRVGFPDPRLVEDAPITVNSAAVQRVMDDAGAQGLKFYSATYRLWNMSPTLLEPHCEDYGQAVIYKGTLPRYASGWLLDKHHYFETGRILPVCGNTYNMLKESLLKDHFEFVGTFDTHFGIFDGCGTSMPFDEMVSTGGKGGASGSTKGGCC